MPSRTSPQSYRLQAEYALEQLRQAHAVGDAARFEEWHRTWSLAAAAADAELTEQGGGVRLLRRKQVRLEISLRPLPPELQVPLPQPTLPLEPPASEPDYQEPGEEREAEEPAAAEPPGLVPLPDAELKALLLRRGMLLQVLQAGGANPLPGELSAVEWAQHLTVFQEEGAAECLLLQQLEEALESFLEQEPDWPEPEEGTLFLDEQHGLTTGINPVCLEIYRKSLLELTETELRADLYTCLEAGRADTVALIEAEIRRRERETEPEPTESDPGRAEPSRSGSSPESEKAGVEQQEPALEPPAADAIAGKPRRRTAVYSTNPPRAKTQPASKEEVVPPTENAGETSLPAYHTLPAWIDGAGRTRTWALLDPAGAKVAEITTKRDAERLVDFLNGMRRPSSPEP